MMLRGEDWAADNNWSHGCDGLTLRDSDTHR